MSKALILGEDTRSFLTVVRSLGRQGVKVHVGWCTTGAPELRSRYITKIHRLPLYHPRDNSWKQALLDLMKEEKFDLTLATNDRTILPLQKHRDELNQHGRFYLLDVRAFEIGFNKEKANELARSLEIPLPKECKISSLDKGLALADEFGLPLVLKPTSSFTLRRLEEKRFVRKAYSHQELQIYLNEMLKDGEVTVQENVLGKGIGIELLADQGEILVAFQHERVHEPLLGGGSSYRKSVPLHQGMLDASKTLVKAMNYTGVAMIEYKHNLATGRWVFIEINARFWGSLPLPVAAGVDFPWYLFQLLVEGKRTFPQNYRINIYCRNLLNDLRWQWQNFKADKSDPTLATLPLWKVALEIRHLLMLRERSDTFVLDDPLPGIMELIELRKLAAEGIRLLHLHLFRIPGIRRFYVSKIIERVKKAKILLFVCKGNICRSPFAHYYAEKLFASSKTIISAGTYQYDNRPSVPEAIEAAKRLGIDLSTHRSKRLDASLVSNADLIFTFDENNRLEVLHEFPTARSKIVRLGLLLDNESPVIADPFGGSVEMYLKTYRMIQQAMERLIS